MQSLRTIYRRWRRKYQSGFTSWDQALTHLEPYVPGSDQFWRYPMITTQAAVDFPEQMLDLCEPFTVLPIEMRAEDLRAKSSFVDLARREFESAGSNKHTVGLEYVYAHLLSSYNPSSIKVILEIGIGTQVPTAISTMGLGWIPGGSLRALGRLFPNAHVHGADIDRTILFSEPRVTCHFVDQTARDSLRRGFIDINSEIDLFIDDGLHSSLSNLNSLLEVMPYLSPNSMICIEDITPSAAKIWRFVGAMLHLRSFSCALVKMPSGQYAFLACEDGHFF